MDHVSVMTSFQSSFFFLPESILTNFHAAQVVGGRFTAISLLSYYQPLTYEAYNVTLFPLETFNGIFGTPISYKTNLGKRRLEKEILSLLNLSHKTGSRQLQNKESSLDCDVFATSLGNNCINLRLLKVMLSIHLHCSF